MTAVSAGSQEALHQRLQRVDVERLGQHRIENPIAVTSDSNYPVQARAFVTFAQSPAGQRLFGLSGCRPVLQRMARIFTFPQPKGPFTIGTLAGWTNVTKQFFNPQSGIMAAVERSNWIGVGS